MGAKLVPDALVRWVRELSVLAVTLRNDVFATAAASQIERELIDPLCAVIDQDRGATP
jgi:hypothetical protein